MNDELEMRFVNVKSAGGIYEDESFAAGWQLGSINFALEHFKPMLLECIIFVGNKEQADLIAMKFNYKFESVDSPNPEFLYARFIKNIDM